MSNIDDVKNKMLEDSELRRKENELRTLEVNRRYDNAQKNKKDLDFFKNIGSHLSSNDPEHIKKVQEDNEKYIMAAKNKMPFIHNDFMNVVPYFARNLILIGANSGEGKSTSAANIILSTMLHNRKVLVITNEETEPDIYNRITCLIKGWAYSNHDKFTDEQRKAFNDYMPQLSKWVKVVDDTFGGGSGVTTTLEGVTGVLESLVRDDIQYDAVVIDFLQNISHSRENPRAPKWEVLERLMEYLNTYKSRYPAPIVMLAQLYNTSDKNKSFEERIRGFKGLMVPMTCVLEIRPDKKSYKSEWIVHKSRWADGMVSQGFVTGWYKGRYVNENNLRYQEWVKDKRMERARTIMMEDIDGKVNDSGT